MRGASVLACRVVAPHLPRADTNLSTKGRNLSEPKSGGVHLQAVGRACSSSRHAWAAGRTALASPSEIEQAAAVRMVARRCACVRFSRAFQGLRRRLSSPPRAARELERASVTQQFQNFCGFLQKRIKRSHSDRRFGFLL